MRKPVGLLATVGIALLLVSGGLSAAMSDSGRVSEDVDVGTFDIEISSIAVGAVVVNQSSPSLHTVACTAPEIVSSTAASYPCPFTIKNIGNIGMTVHVTATAPVVPFVSLLPLPVPDVYLVAGESHEYWAGLTVTRDLDNGDLGKTATITYTATVAEGLPQAPTAAPTKADAPAGGIGSITIPSAAHVDYFVDGVPTAAGTHPFAVGTYSVTAVAQAGFQLVGYPAGGWSLAIVQLIADVPVTAPTKADQPCDASAGSITIPSVAHAAYSVDGVLTAAGTYPFAVGTYAVTAVAQGAGYQLSGYPVGGWSLTIVQQMCIEFVGTTAGPQAGTSVALPAGWEPGDLAVVVVMRNATATPPTIPSGWTSAATTTGGSGTSQVSSRLLYRVLQPGDTGISWGATTFRAARMVVYRNASFGAVSQQGSTSTTLTFPALTLQVTNGSSWVGAMATNFNGIGATAPTGMVNRGTGAAAFDTDGGVAAFPSRTISPVGQPWNSFSFELKVN
jgi:hypothetical protein